MKSIIRPEVLAFLFILLILIPVHTQVERPMLLLERFFPGWGWIEILFLAVYGSFVTGRMVRADNTAAWRLRIWTLFSVVFFSQLILGLLGQELFLMTGKLHFPIPGLIVAGPVYRFQIGFMPILFLSTIVLSGPAWCSQLCYFGAIDGLLAKKGKPKPLKNKSLIRHSIFLFVILAALTFRLVKLDAQWVIAAVAVFGLTGLGIILYFSRRKGAMVHCTTYCPVGVVVSYLKYINPFRIVIGDECTLCRKCIRYCRYDALNVEHLQAGKPGATCTWCGDCLSACSTRQIRYKFLSLSPENARLSWIVLTVVIHSVFLGLARI